jgi:hypothetical protein
MPPTVKLLIAAGLALVALGLLWWAFGHRLHWLGRLPGDIRIERENFRFYFPLTTMILLSLLLTLLVNLVRRYWPCGFKCDGVRWSAMKCDGVRWSAMECDEVR